MKGKQEWSRRVILAFTTSAFLAAGWLGCSKDVSTPTDGGLDGSQTATLRGVVTDADSLGDTRIGGALVTPAGMSTVTANARGEFTLVLPAGVRHTVRVSQEGYSLNELVVTLTAGAVQNVTIGLLRTGTTTPIAAGTGGTVADEGYTL
ncbi:MAG: hypothetical protein H6Q29_604, partial [Bacteroidetes bacterium]|nr:hypothetical protein [Bacteroidota bacterium]